MVHFFLHFAHTPELAAFVLSVYNEMTYDRIEDARIGQLYRAMLFTKDFGGIDNGDNEEPKQMQVYNDVFVLVDRFSCVPICLINSMLMRVHARGKIYVERVTFNAHMITKVVEYICDDENNWPVQMTKHDKIAAACTQYSMRAMDLFDGDVPRGLSGTVTYFVYELPMAPHGFLVYLLEIYMVVAQELGALDVVRAFFAQFARGDGDVFDLLNSYGICVILLMLDDETFPNLDAETIDEEVMWVLPLLDDLMHVPALAIDLPEFIDGMMGSEEIVAPSPTPPGASNTPLSALLTDVEVQALFSSPFVALQTPVRGRLTPRQLF